MSGSIVFGLGGAALVGIGLHGLILAADPLRKVIAFNILGAGVFVLFGMIAQRGSGGGFGGDPVPQALVLTGIVVAFAATALAIGLLTRLGEERETASLEPQDEDPRRRGDGR